MNVMKQITKNFAKHIIAGEGRLAAENLSLHSQSE